MFEDEQNNQELNENNSTETNETNVEQEAHIEDMIKDESLINEPQDILETIDSQPDKTIDNLPAEEDIALKYEEEAPVTVQPVQFASFDEEENIQGKENRNLDLLMNVNLQMSVELGRTELPFKKVLELTRGSIISLDKLAGEPVELFANGKLVAFGEVVVIEDNFGLRITSIAAAEERLKTVHETNEKQ